MSSSQVQITTNERDICITATKNGKSTGQLLITIVLIVVALTNPTLSFAIKILAIITLILLFINMSPTNTKVTLKGEKGRSIEITTSTSTSKSNIEFIPIDIINDIVIHEQIQAFKVETYLAFTFNPDRLQETTSIAPPLKPLFTQFNFSLNEKQAIYQAVHSFLHSN